MSARCPLPIGCEQVHHPHGDGGRGGFQLDLLERIDGRQLVERFDLLILLDRLPLDQRDLTQARPLRAGTVGNAPLNHHPFAELESLDHFPVTNGSSFPEGSCSSDREGSRNPSGGFREPPRRAANPGRSRRSPPARPRIGAGAVRHTALVRPPGTRDADGRSRPGRPDPARRDPVHPGHPPADHLPDSGIRSPPLGAVATAAGRLPAAPTTRPLSRTLSHLTHRILTFSASAAGTTATPTTARPSILLTSGRVTAAVPRRPIPPRPFLARRRGSFAPFRLRFVRSKTQISKIDIVERIDGPESSSASARLDPERFPRPRSDPARSDPARPDPPRPGLPRPSPPRSPSLRPLRQDERDRRVRCRCPNPTRHRRRNRPHRPGFENFRLATVRLADRRGEPLRIANHSDRPARHHHGRDHRVLARNPDAAAHRAADGLPAVDPHRNGRRPTGIHRHSRQAGQPPRRHGPAADARRDHPATGRHDPCHHGRGRHGRHDAARELWERRCLRRARAVRANGRVGAGSSDSTRAGRRTRVGRSATGSVPDSPLETSRVEGPRVEASPDSASATVRVARRRGRAGASSDEALSEAALERLVRVERAGRSSDARGSGGTKIRIPLGEHFLFPTEIQFGIRSTALLPGHGPIHPSRETIATNANCENFPFPTASGREHHLTHAVNAHADNAGRRCDTGYVEIGEPIRPCGKSTACKNLARPS